MRRKGSSDLAALEGKSFDLDKAMTIVSFILLFVIVVIPVFMIIYNAFFFCIFSVWWRTWKK